MKRFAAACAIILSFNALSYAQEYYSRFSPTGDITLEQAIRLGLENNSTLLSVEQSILIAEQRVKEAQYQRLPQFDLMATATSYNLDYATVLPEAMGLRIIGTEGNSFYGGTVSAVQYLYSGGRISGTIKLAKANLKEEKSRYDTVKNKVILEVKLAYYNMLYAQKRLELAKETYARARKYHKNLNAQGWAAVSAAGVLERFRIEYNSAQHAYSNAHLQMLRAINREFNSTITVRGDFKPFVFEGDLSKLTLWAMQFRPELRTALYEVEMYNISSNIALGQKYPDIILGASYEQVGQDSLDDTNKQVSLAVRLPLSYGMFTQSKQKKAQQKQSVLRRSDLEDTIRGQVSAGLSALNFWQGEVLSRESALDSISAEIRRSEAAARYNLDALHALEAYRTAALSRLEAVKENLTSKSQLEWAIGQDL